MVKKLLKQEMIYYVRSLLPVYIILLGISLTGRIIHIFESRHWIYTVVANSSLGAYILSVIVTMLFMTIFIVIRYYKNMFTGEGYLTLTLPVSIEQHLAAKLLAAMIVSVCTIAAAAISVMVFLGGEWMIEIYKAAAYLLTFVIEKVGGHFTGYVIEVIILGIAGLVTEILNYYMCISLGQMCKKRRILAAIGIYYGIYIAIQVIVTVITIVITFVVENMDLTEWEKWLEIHYKGVLHGCLITGIIGALAVSAVMFFISRTVLKKRLNLE